MVKRRASMDGGLGRFLASPPWSSFSRNENDEDDSETENRRPLKVVQSILYLGTASAEKTATFAGRRMRHWLRKPRRYARELRHCRKLYMDMHLENKQWRWMARPTSAWRIVWRLFLLVFLLYRGFVETRRSWNRVRCERSHGLLLTCAPTRKRQITDSFLDEEERRLCVAAWCVAVVEMALSVRTGSLDATANLDMRPSAAMRRYATRGLLLDVIALPPWAESYKWLWLFLVSLSSSTKSTGVATDAWGMQFRRLCYNAPAVRWSQRFVKGAAKARAILEEEPPYGTRWLFEWLGANLFGEGGLYGEGMERYTNILFKCLPMIADFAFEMEVFYSYAASVFTSLKLVLLLASIIHASRERRALFAALKGRAARRITSALRSLHTNQVRRQYLKRRSQSDDAIAANSPAKRLSSKSSLKSAASSTASVVVASHLTPTPSSAGSATSPSRIIRPASSMDFFLTSDEFEEEEEDEQEEEKDAYDVWQTSFDQTPPGQNNMSTPPTATAMEHHHHLLDSRPPSSLMF